MSKMNSYAFWQVNGNTRKSLILRAIILAMAAVLVAPESVYAQAGAPEGISDRLKSLFKKKSASGTAAQPAKAPPSPVGSTVTGTAAVGTGTAAAGAAGTKSPSSPGAAPASAVLPPWPGTTRFVDPNNPASVNDGEGTAAAPYRTIEYAMTRLQPGDRLLLAPTVFREPILFPARTWESAAMTLVETVPGAKSQAVIKGSKVVTAWAADGPRGRFSAPWDVQPQQVFLNGKPLQQIGGTLFGARPPDIMTPDLAPLHLSQGGIWPGRISGDQSALTPKSFYYDFSGKRLYIDCDCDSILPFLVEVSVLKNVMSGSGLRNITVRNIAFTHSNLASFGRGGAINLGGKNLTLENLDVSYMDTVAVLVSGENVTVSNSRISQSGSVGISGKGTAFKITKNRVYRNNTRGFNKWWEAGGMKFIGGTGGVTDSEVSGNTALENFGDGIWFDTGNHRNVVRDNVAIANRGFGIHYEASYDSAIFSNFVLANQQRGIYVLEGSGNTIAHNVVIGNELEGIVVADGGRTNTAEYDYRPKGNTVCGNLVAWNKHSITLPVEQRDNKSDFNVIVGIWPDYSFDRGWWPTSQREIGLGGWRSITGQDKNSVLLSLPRNESLIRGFVEKPEEIDFAGLEATVTSGAANINRMPCAIYAK